jgi:hypothetical protein
MKVIPGLYKIIPSKNDSNDVIYLYHKCYKYAKSVLRKWGCNSQNFKDIYQDVFIILMGRQINSETETEISSGYIINLCKYLWFKERKKEQIHELNDQMDQVDEVYTGSKDVMIFLLHKHLKNLSAKCREILFLFAMNYTEQKISKALKLEGPKEVNNRKEYCKSKLKSMITDDPLYKEING